ncbi:MAG: hypothetical protein AB7O67_07375 [Vicinamibacterales bacterium]
MPWQEVGVFLIVSGAVVFLVRRFMGPRKKKGGTTAFVPLGEVKRNSGCH